LCAPRIVRSVAAVKSPSSDVDDASFERPRETGVRTRAFRSETANQSSLLTATANVASAARPRMVA
jgi:hypothetical protein